MFIHKRLLMIALGTAMMACACDKSPNNSASISDSNSSWPSADALSAPEPKALLPNACTLVTASEAQALLGIE
ncbi:MAG: hypothetical protein ACRERV_09810, partial [Methylococcales bacterium]